jgi:regulator of nucleoside diphosphate kinase
MDPSVSTPLARGTVTAALPKIIVTTQDVERLHSLLDTLPDGKRGAAQRLEAELARAEVVDPTHMPPDVVTMNSRVIYEDVESGEPREAVLVYPHDADAATGRVSVLAPIGSALLGLCAGQIIEWPLPGGRSKRLRVVRIPYQPEAAGDFHL